MHGGRGHVISADDEEHVSDETAYKGMLQPYMTDCNSTWQWCSSICEID